MASEPLDTTKVTLVRDQPARGWVTELSRMFPYREELGWRLDPVRRVRWAAHPGWCDDRFPPSDPQSLLTG